jgi:hypothetical protein
MDTGQTPKHDEEPLITPRPPGPAVTPWPPIRTWETKGPVTVREGSPGPHAADAAFLAGHLAAVLAAIRDAATLEDVARHPAVGNARETLAMWQTAQDEAETSRRAEEARRLGHRRGWAD